MYNENYPKENELPSSKQLIIATITAVVVACILLITAILPAEYGIDPTGLGKALGLKQMGEIKTQLAEEAQQEAASATIQPELSTPIEQTAIKPIADKPLVETIETTEEVKSVPSEAISITLAPGEAAEVKAGMNKEQTVSYKWTIDKGHLNFDNHGDNANIKYHNYSKGKAVKSDEGKIKAAFDGSHGWFWRNRSNETVTVSLEVTGEFSSFKRVL